MQLKTHRLTLATGAYKDHSLLLTETLMMIIVNVTRRSKIVSRAAAMSVDNLQFTAVSL